MKPLLKIWPPLIVAIVLSYFFVDRPVCSFVYYHSWPQHLSVLNTFVSGWPPGMTSLAPFLLFAGFLFPHGRARETVILTSLSIMLSFLLKNDLKWVFSRDWPTTWIHNNPSWITNHAYGFQWFQGAFFQAGETTGSFPSGHAAIAFGSLLPLGLMYRRSLGCCVALATLEGLAMVAFDYHFLSDVFAGALVGITCTLALRTLIQPRV
jgi:membrane-associated phospholipid phosphatase